MKNAFNDMEEDNIRSFYDGSSDLKIRSRINNSLGTMRFLGQIADVYVNQLVKTMTKIAAGTEDNIEKRRENTDGLNKKRLDKNKYPNL